MSSLHDRLLNMLEDEVERQENVLAVCMAQAEALKTNDLEYLEAKTAALVALIQDAAQSARERSVVVQAILAEAGLAVDGTVRFSCVLAASPEPCRGRLAETHGRLRAVLNETRPAAFSNALTLRTALRTMNGTLAAGGWTAPAGAEYDATGMRPAKRGLLNTMDKRG